MPAIAQLSGLAPEALVQTVLMFSGGIARRLPRVGSIDTNPYVAFLTGIRTPTGSQHPANVCGNCVVIDHETICRAAFPFGRVCYSNNIVIEQFIQRLNRGEVQPEMLGELVPQEVVANLRSRVYDQRTILQSSVAYGMTLVLAGLATEISINIWQGTGSGGSGYSTPVGLENLITSPSTYITPVVSGGSCTPAYPTIINYNNDYNATNTTVGSMLVAALNRLSSILSVKARGTGFDDMEWAICMPPELAELVKQMWSAAYATTFGYQLPSGTSFVVDASAVAKMREAIEQESAMYIGGRRYVLVPDPGIAVTTAANENTANIYFLPLRSGRLDTLYLHYLDLSQFQNWPDVQGMTWTDGGMVQWWWTQSGPCVSISGMTQYRPVLLTPHLAGAVVGVQWPVGTPAWPVPVHPGAVG